MSNHKDREPRLGIAAEYLKTSAEGEDVQSQHPKGKKARNREYSDNEAELSPNQCQAPSHSPGAPRTLSWKLAQK